MKLPGVVGQFFAGKGQRRTESYLALVLEEMAVQSCVWTLGGKGEATISDAVMERIPDTSWEKRLEACDRAIARLAEHEGRDDFEKVVLGLPAYYLDEQDNINHSTGIHIKKLTQELELTPIGFVPIHQAIINMMKQDEGVAPSVILLESGTKESRVLIYKVGAVVARAVIPNDDLVPALERTFKGFVDLEVLPSRILLYGSHEGALADDKRDLLKHPWPVRANFIHYPKIEIIPVTALASSVARAGASELASHMENTTKEESPSEEVLPQSTSESPRTIDPAPRARPGGEATEEAVSFTQTPPTDEEISASGKDTEEAGRESDDSNLVEVAPETLGFRQNVDILEKPEDGEEGPERRSEFIGSDGTASKGKQYGIVYRARRLVSGWSFASSMRGVRIPRSGILALATIIIIAGVGWWFIYWVFPRANITILQVPETITQSFAVTVNPTATVADAATKIIPGRKQERTVSGNKKISVTGKKDVGDPARGTVTVYNKSISTRTFKKGTIISTGSLQFTLDNDVTVASKSVNLSRGEETYGQGSVSVTAAALGPNGNAPTGKEFAFKDFSSDIASAWNEKAFSGGTSNVVTVVSRSDYDALIADLTKDLIAKAKEELAQSIAGGERLIDETIKTNLTDKKFSAEPGQETNELSGSITVVISGLSFRDEDVASVFAGLVQNMVPSGYVLRANGETIHVTNTKLIKDGSVSVSMEYANQALPVFDISAIQRSLAGKSQTQVADIVRSIKGAGGMEIGAVSGMLRGQRLPVNPGNIHVTVAVME